MEKTQTHKAPRKHHFIPKRMQEGWSDKNSLIFGVDRRVPAKPRAFIDKPCNVNSENHLYSVYEEKGQRNSFLETALYKPLDDSAANLTSQILEALKRGMVPQLDKSARRLLWQFYIYNSVKRRPDAKDFMFDPIFEAEVNQRIFKNAKAEGLELTTQELEYSIEEKTNLLQSFRGEQSEQSLAIMEQNHVRFWSIEGKGSFVLPDRPISLLDRVVRYNRKMVIPISPHFAIQPIIGIEKCDHRTFLPAQVRLLNEVWYSNSTTVISTSQQLLKSLAKKIDDQSIRFQHK
ncbi:DUF4238 domain-containing protein [Hirschia litorea]|uniref:DUF4238 domain-containing protein n=1 Tax=Hirschia litorea TaxID=1199156 RepID=A0ABW2IP64_9PROT